MSYEGFEAPVCANASCHGRCGDMDATICACDQYCMLLGICCIDYQAKCIKNTSFANSNITEEFLERYTQQQVSQCGYPGLVSVMIPSIMRLISRCPLSAHADKQELCANITYDHPTVSKMLLVYSKSSGLVFKNEYCAICNGIMDWIPINMYVLTLAGTSTTDLIYVAKTQGTDGILRLLMKEYQREDFHQGVTVKFTFDLYALPVSHVRLICRQKESQYHHCPHSHLPLVREFCDSYRSPVGARATGLLATYDNWHRLKYDCDEFDYRSEGINCSRFEFHEEHAYDKSTSLVISHSGIRYYNKHVFCGIDQIADMMTNECVTRPCGFDSLLISGSCHSVSSDMAIAPTPLTLNQLHVVLVLSHSQPLARAVTLIRYFLAYRATVEWEAISCRPFTAELSVFCVTFRLGYSVNYLFSIMSHKDSREYFFSLFQNSLGNVSLIALFNYDPMVELTCRHGELEHNDNALMLTDTRFGMAESYWYDTMKIVIPRHPITYSIDSVAVKLSWSVKGSGQTVEYNARQVSVAACADNTTLTTCQPALFRSHEYTVDVNDDTTLLSLVNSTKSFQISSNDIVITDDNTLIICETTLSKAREVKKKNGSPRNANLIGGNLGISLLIAIYVAY